MEKAERIFIYTLTNPIGQVYVGQTSKNPETRFAGHVNAWKTMRNTGNKYGSHSLAESFDLFPPEVWIIKSIAIVRTKAEANRLERHLIRKSGTLNISARGFRKRKPYTEDRKKSISSGVSRQWKITRPDGTVEVILNLHQYCKTNGLTTSQMSLCASGKRESYRGYTVKKQPVVL